MLKDLVMRSRSFRSFDESAPVPCEALLDWIDCARFCPSSINLQMLKFRPVYTPQECAQVLPLTRWAGKLKDLSLPPKGHAPTAYIVVCTDNSVIEGAERFQKDVGIAAQTILLAACESGFGGCMIGSFSPDELCKALSLPDGIRPQLVIALGKPDEHVELVDLPKDGDTSYYRKNGVHYSPKRSLDDLVIH